MRKISFLVLFTTLLLLSCVSPDKVRMVAVEDFTLVDETRFEVTVRIENLNRSSLTIKSASLVLVENQVELIELSLDGRVVIPRSSNRGLVFPIVLTMSDPEVLAALPEKTKSGNKMMVVGRITGQVGIFSKSYKIGPMPVDEFLAMLDEENRDMIKGFIY